MKMLPYMQLLMMAVKMPLLMATKIPCMCPLKEMPPRKAPMMTVHGVHSSGNIRLISWMLHSKSVQSLMTQNQHQGPYSCSCPRRDTRSHRTGTCGW